jgi:hypothetical protein
LGHLIVHLVLFLLVHVQLQNRGNIFFLHFSDCSVDLNGLLLLKTIFLFEIFHRHIKRPVGILYFTQFFRVNEPIHVVRSAEWGGHAVTRGIVGLGVPV